MTDDYDEGKEVHEPQKIKTIRLKEIKRGEDLFRSSGISKIKVTKDSEVMIVEIPIQSTGVAELIDTFNKDRPKPPSKDRKIEPDSEIGKDLGITKTRWMKIPDVTDEGYLEEKEKFESDLGTAIVLKGLALDIVDEEGNLIEEEKKKINTLRDMGMSGDQFTQVVNDITNLTKWTEEEERRFFG